MQAAIAELRETARPMPKRTRLQPSGRGVLGSCYRPQRLQCPRYTLTEIADRSVRGKGTSGNQPICATCVPVSCARGVWVFLARHRVLTWSGLCCGHRHTADPYGVRRSGPDQSRVLEDTLLHTGSPDPVSRRLHQTTPCPLLLRCPRDLDGLRRRSRSLGRVPASRITSASAASFFWRLTKG